MATSKTLKFKDVIYDTHHVNIGKGDSLHTYYSSKYNDYVARSRAVTISLSSNYGPFGKWHYMTKVKVTYKNPGCKFKTKTYKLGYKFLYQ